MPILKKLNNFILDTLFPIYCLNCHKEGEWICHDCQSKIKIQSEYVCGVCEKKIVPDGRTCHECKRKNPLDALIPAARYDEPFISQAVHLFKYRFVEDLHIPLANLIVKALQKTDLHLADIIIPVPLHSRRLRWRGFNQSLLLSRHVSRNLLPQNEIPVSQNLLERTRFTLPQMEIKNYFERKHNINGAFCVKNKDKVKDKKILLIDDITTTGSTIFECAKVLKEAGAREVYCAVIARQNIDK